MNNFSMTTATEVVRRKWKASKCFHLLKNARLLCVDIIVVRSYTVFIYYFFEIQNDVRFLFELIVIAQPSLFHDIVRRSHRIAATKKKFSFVHTTLWLSGLSRSKRYLFQCLADGRRASMRKQLLLLFCRAYDECVHGNGGRGYGMRIF